ncbi:MULTISPECIES: hypothetical protein [unclassified Streptomyces]|uniref:hypothetical protein n=1 Tax=unclassified Streptomyces TaxID=2593676 RepID=UPI001F3C7766|nr:MULTISPECIES: hypothetical protein [unclassified Streptomyces]MCF0086582.1 hypothetical protein [Streptomyces sp. MH192]MCF0098736.1 hypothetical protein [Streptomyces sp. MH191]
MAAQLATTVYVTDPDSHQTVELAPGTSPEPRLAALVTNPAAWVDRKPPRLPKTGKDSQEELPTGDGPDDASGDDSGTAGDDSPTGDSKPAAKRPARKTGTRGRAAAGEGTSGE